MNATKTVQHQAYELVCGTTAIDGGRFTPSLTLSKLAWPRRPRVIAVPRGPYASGELAIEAAYAQGVEWIRDYG